MKSLFVKFRLQRRSRKATKKLLRSMRKKGVHVYTNKRRAIRKGKVFTFFQRRVFYVMPSENLFYVLSVEDVRRLNKNNMDKRNGIKIRERDLSKDCIWRSPMYSKL